VDAFLRFLFPKSKLSLDFDVSIVETLSITSTDDGDDEMALENKAPIGSRWKFRSDTTDRVWVVTDRKPGGVLEYKQENRARFGQCYLRDWLVNAEPLAAA